MKKVLIVAGESSGDLHGSLLMSRMTGIDPEIEFRGIGGPLMENEGLKAIRTTSQMNIMGFAEVIRHLPFLRKTMQEMETLLKEWAPDLVILIDYPGFNLRFAKIAKTAGSTVMYYISPQLWAWHTSRVEIIRKYVDRMVVLFEFEKEFYLNYGINADFVGHPLLEVVKPSEHMDNFRKSLGISLDKKILGLVPGSRPQEIKRMLSPMAEAAMILSREENIACVLACAPGLEDDLYSQYIKGTNIIPVKNRTYDVMAWSDALAVTSGTATIESGITGTPMVIAYRTSPITYFIGKMLVDVKNIGMINIVAGKRIVPELWQNEVTSENLVKYLREFLENSDENKKARDSLALAKSKLGSGGASLRAASIAMEMLGKR